MENRFWKEDGSDPDKMRMYFNNFVGVMRLGNALWQGTFEINRANKRLPENEQREDVNSATALMLLMLERDVDRTSIGDVTVRRRVVREERKEQEYHGLRHPGVVGRIYSHTTPAQRETGVIGSSTVTNIAYDPPPEWEDKVRNIRNEKEGKESVEERPITTPTQVSVRVNNAGAKRNVLCTSKIDIGPGDTDFLIREVEIFEGYPCRLEEPIRIEDEITAKQIVIEANKAMVDTRLALDNWEEHIFLSQYGSEEQTQLELLRS